MSNDLTSTLKDKFTLLSNASHFSDLPAISITLIIYFDPLPVSRGTSILDFSIKQIKETINNKLINTKYIYCNIENNDIFSDIEEENCIDGLIIKINQLDGIRTLNSIYMKLNEYYEYFNSNKYIKNSTCSMILNIVNTPELNNILFYKLTHYEEEMNSIKLVNVRKNKTLLSIPIKDKYTIERFISIMT
ncbi:MAG: hypothetical protein ACTSU7_11405 [Candidatus Heimdallarchaeaceae archaeon]